MIWLPKGYHETYVADAGRGRSPGTGDVVVRATGTNGNGRVLASISHATGPTWCYAGESVMSRREWEGWWGRGGRTGVVGQGVGQGWWGRGGGAGVVGQGRSDRGGGAGEVGQGWSGGQGW